jgi:hypothetical protein
VRGGTIADWDDTFAFVLGNEVSGDRQFQGVFRIVAVYNRALTPAQITRTSRRASARSSTCCSRSSHLVDDAAGVHLVRGEPVRHRTLPVRQADVHQPRPAAKPGCIPVAGMRIGGNGAEAHVGRRTARSTPRQRFRIRSGRPAARLRSAPSIALEKGPSLDEFFLTFDVLGRPH